MSELSKGKQLKQDKVENTTVKRFRKCRYCGEKKVPYGAVQPFCFAGECIKAHNVATKAKEKRNSIRNLKEESVSYWIKIAVKTFNAYIRERDKALPCVSCGYIFEAIGNMTQDDIRQAHAGHLRPAGNHSILRFNTDNVWRQCSICNNYKSGNVGAYEKELRARIGDDRVDSLFQNNEPKKWTIEELKGIISLYKKKKASL